MTTALYIYYTPSWQPLADIVLPIAARYCERWGYAKEFILGVEREQKDMPVGYCKMSLLRELMEQYSIIWVMDCDCLITNDQIDIRFYNSFGADVFFAEDVNGINAGSWLIRSTDRAKTFIDAVLSDFDAPEEQTVIKRHIDMVHVCKLPHPSINSYLYTEYLNDWAAKVGDVPMPTHEQGSWQPGDFILHLPGLTLERRIEIFNMIKEQA